MSNDGLVAKGNINLFNRPVINNPITGGLSTVYSMSFRDERPWSPYFGKEVLVPLATEGRILSDAEARDRFYRTGEHLGVFHLPEQATSFARNLHKEYEKGFYNLSSPSQPKVNMKPMGVMDYIFSGMKAK